MNGKVIATLIGLSLAIIALCNMNTKPTVEGWWGGTQFVGGRKMPVLKAKNGQESAFSGNYYDPNAMMGSNKFVSVPSFQAVLAPRFSNVQYGANIKYNMPDRQNMASPCDPLTYGDYPKENFKSVNNPYFDKENFQKPDFPRSAVQRNLLNQNNSRENFQNPRENFQNPRENFQNIARENFQSTPSKEGYCAGGCANCGTGQCGGGCPVSCGKGGYGMGHAVDDSYGVPPGYENGNKQAVYDSLPASGINGGGDIPVGSIATVNELGESEQFLAFNRIMPANTRASSRLYAQSDYIRGDLPIVPCQSGWFSVYPDIARDVNQGALAVMGGIGASDPSMMKLMTTASAGTTFAGVDLAESLPMYNADMAVQNITSLQAGMSDIQVTSFP